MRKNRLLKRVCIGSIATICVLTLCFVAYWEYLGYKFEQDPLFYYRPRIYNYLDQETADIVAAEFNRKAKNLRDSLGRIPTAEEMMSVLPDNHRGDFCPICKSSDVGRFVYGRMIMDSAATEKVKNQEWILAGCTLWSKSPKYKCNSCFYEWGSHVVFVNRIKAKD